MYDAKLRFCLVPIGFAILMAGCQTGEMGQKDAPVASPIETRLNKYTTVRLTTDTTALTASQKELVLLLIDAVRPMDEAFWIQAYGEPAELLQSVSHESIRRFLQINYGPWDRLDKNQPFVDGVGPKPPGANYYPADMTKEEFESAAGDSPALKSLYTMVRRDAQGKLAAIPYSQVFAAQYAKAAEKLRAAAAVAENPALKKYLSLRAQALLSDDYRESDLAWMDMKDNVIDVVIGPIETYEDQLFGLKAANEGYVLVKDSSWSERLSRYAALLPELQRGLPVPPEYKRETPGTDSELHAYDVVYYAGDANAGSKTIAINLPNDEQVQLQKGTRRLQLKNAMQAKFDRILLPLADTLLHPGQRSLISFDAFFSNVMFHEIAHGLGIKHTIRGSGTVRSALKEKASALEEAKADVLGLFMITQLMASGELEDRRNENYVTFLASILRSIRFGAASAHGRANLAEFNFLLERGAIEHDTDTRTYRVNLERIQSGIDDLAARILTFQGDGDYQGVTSFMEKYGRIGEGLQSQLDRLAEQRIPVDIVFEQGVEVLGLDSSPVRSIQ